jgi:hypothetical protein
MDFQLEQTIAILERTPRILRTWLEDLPEHWVTSNEGPDTFNAWDVVGHLIDGEEDDWIPRLGIILEHGKEKPFTPFDRFAFREKYKGKTLAELLETFEKLRRRNLAHLRALNLQPSQFELEGTHPEFGPVTLSQLIATWSVHDLGHIIQIARVMAKQYKNAVGPWKKYISILGSGMNPVPKGNGM